ncbi:fungal hydrophobin [Pluteus cervinus]|uniref:Fungal hydrophobin n=1 Tax=Pluteus cervinus TaxID=181527 RepID=A0ACD3AGZ2_9AGAR|nr:fungal hydrophobin [Pluteus cervinus]
MFSRVYSVFFLFFALPLMASAASIGGIANIEARTGVSQCNTGSLTCCASTQSASSVGALSLVGIVLGLLGIVVGDLTGEIGLTCTSVIGGTSCSQQPVCCSNVVSNSLIGINCSPINIAL